MIATACKRPFSLGCVAHTDGAAVFQVTKCFAATIKGGPVDLVIAEMDPPLDRDLYQVLILRNGFWAPLPPFLGRFFWLVARWNRLGKKEKTREKP